MKNENKENIILTHFHRLLMFVVAVAVFLPQSVVAQTVKGKVTDAISGEALIGAAVRVMELPLTGVATDADGEFSITLAHSGRYTIETTYVGYEPSVLKEVLVAGAKDVVLDITLRENSTELTEVVVKPRVNKEATVNPTALVGGMMLSMEEASRYAGGYNDPARLVTAFAGVSGQGDSNGISVHGNAPQFMQYRLEGVEIFSPNHFADLYSAGFGMVSSLNSNVITNSDFFVSTFNSSYNNALSGVFDVKMRSGNNTYRWVRWVSSGPAKALSRRRITPASSSTTAMASLLSPAS